MPSGRLIPQMMRVLILSMILLFFPISWTLGPDGKWVFGVDAARAHSDDGDDDDEEDEEDDEDDDDDDDDDGEDDDDDDDDEEDDTDDSSGGSDDDDDNRGVTGNGGSAGTGGGVGTQKSGDDRRVPGNLHLRYPNGWDEQILNGRYILIDPKGRKVTNRRATMDDLDRMRDAAGL